MYQTVFLLYLSTVVCVMNVSYAQTSLEIMPQTCDDGNVMVGIDQNGKITCRLITSILNSVDPSTLEASLRAQRNQYRKEKRKLKQVKLDREESDLDQWVKQLTPIQYQVIKKKWESYLNDVDKITGIARVIPYENIGIKFFGIRRKSLLYKLGIKNGDVIMSVNRMELSNPNQVFKVYQHLLIAESIDVELKRRGKVMQIQYQFVEQF